MRCLGIVHLYAGCSLFAFLLLGKAHCPADISYVPNVANKLREMLRKDEEKTEDLIEAEEHIRWIPFHTFDEGAWSDVMYGIKLTNYRSTIERVFGSLSVQENVKNEIRAAQFVDDMQPVVRNFQFVKGKTGSFVFGMVATVKHGDMIDVAYWIYFLHFEISPRVIEHRPTKLAFGLISIGTEWRESKERDLSVEEHSYMKNYFNQKAIEEYKDEYLGI